MILDLSRITDEESLSEHLVKVGDWLTLQPVELIGPDGTAALLAQRLLEAS